MHWVLFWTLEQPTPLIPFKGIKWSNETWYIATLKKYTINMCVCFSFSFSWHKIYQNKIFTTRCNVYKRHLLWYKLHRCKPVHHTLRTEVSQLHLPCIYTYIIDILSYYFFFFINYSPAIACSIEYRFDVIEM